MSQPPGRAHSARGSPWAPASRAGRSSGQRCLYLRELAPTRSGLASCSGKTAHRHSPRENPPACLPTSRGVGVLHAGSDQALGGGPAGEGRRVVEGSFLPGALPDPGSRLMIDPRLQLWGSRSWKGPGPPSLCTSLEGLLRPSSGSRPFQPQGTAPQPPCIPQVFSPVLFLVPLRPLEHLLPRGQGEGCPSCRWCLHVGRPGTQRPGLAVSLGLCLCLTAPWLAS